MFLPVQTILRNALTVARHAMHLSDEAYTLYLKIIDLLSDKRHARVGVGDEFPVLPAGAVRDPDRIRLPGDAVVPVELVSALYKYSIDLLITELVAEGSDPGTTFQFEKKYPDNTTRRFPLEQLPLKTDNFKLIVTLTPGAYFKRAAVLQQLSD